MRIRNLTLVAAYFVCITGCSSSANKASSTRAADTAVDASPDAFAGAPCNAPQDCASSNAALTCVPNGDSTSSCQPCWYSDVETACGITSDQQASFEQDVSFSQDGTCSVDSCDTSGGLPSFHAQCRLYKYCGPDQHWDANKCGCADGSAGPGPSCLTITCLEGYQCQQRPNGSGRCEPASN